MLEQAKKSPATSLPTAEAELALRMKRAQRHRLLHGYPMAPLLQYDFSERPWSALALDATRPLLVGVLPHPFCNPQLRGCGFCTFPHEKHSNEAARAVVARVVREIEHVAERLPELPERSVHALYFGGGTANLTPPESFQALASTLERTFDLRAAEISFEGVARYFLTRNEALLDVLSGMNVRHRRLSIGIQTFAPEWLARMGRSAFGTEEHFTALVRTAHARGMTISCDLLFNLPGQSPSEALADVERAAELGFDQICIYNLVLDPSIDSAWASDRSLLSRVVPPEKGCDRWLVLRERLRLLGYVQTTLTNFERADVAASDRPFLYERASFDPARYDAVGFGPGAISTLTAPAEQHAIKWMNEGSSAEYLALIDERGGACVRSFDYDPHDLRLLHITRSLSALAIPRAKYRAFFGTDVAQDFPDIVDAACGASLVERAGDDLALTPRGMFYADAVAGLFAWRRTRRLRDANDSIRHAMG